MTIVAFRQSTVTRAVKAMRAAGVEVQRVEIDPSGKIVIHTGADKAYTDDQALEEWIERHAARKTQGRE